MAGAEEENWPEREESLEFAVFEAATVERAKNVSFCMKREKNRVIDSAERSYLSDRAGVTCLRGMKCTLTIRARC